MGPTTDLPLGLTPSPLFIGETPGQTLGAQGTLEPPRADITGPSEQSGWQGWEVAHRGGLLQQARPLEQLAELQRAEGIIVSMVT